MSSGQRENLLKEFSVYDTTVDVVSSWESALNHIFDEEFSQFYFDRFPSLDAEGRSLKPDFTVFFDETYGIIGEIKRTFPNDREAIFTELDQLSNYDDDLGILNANKDRVVPENCDLLVIIEGSSAPQIGTRLNRIILEEEDYVFSKNLVLIRYQFNQDAIKSRYEFQRVTQLEMEFRDGDLDVTTTLSNIVGESGEYQTLSVYPHQFNSFKVRKPICNDAPPGPYLATFLWHKIFPSYLTEDQYEIWQATNGQKEMPIDISVEGLTEEVNDYMHGGKVRNHWVRRALDFLCGADLAESQEGDNYKIKFMGFVQNVGEKSFQEGSQEREQTRELADIFIRRFCESVTEKEEARIESFDEEEDGDEDSSSKQAGLDRFV